VKACTCRLSGCWSPKSTVRRHPYRRSGRSSTRARPRRPPYTVSAQPVRLRSVRARNGAGERSPLARPYLRSRLIPKRTRGHSSTARTCRDDRFQRVEMPGRRGGGRRSTSRAV
jgi:hypothetical protein